VNLGGMAARAERRGNEYGREMRGTKGL